MKNMTPIEAFGRIKFGSEDRRFVDIIVKSGDPHLIYNAALEMSRPLTAWSDRKIKNIGILCDAIIEYGDPWWAYAFALNVRYANTNDIIDFVLVKTPEYIKKLFNKRPYMKRKYEEQFRTNEIRAMIRNTLS